MHFHELGLALPDGIELHLQPASRQDERRGWTANLNAPDREQHEARNSVGTSQMALCCSLPGMCFAQVNIVVQKQSWPG